MLPANECHLWAVAVDDALAGDDALYRSWLSPDEQAGLSRFLFERDRREHLVSRALARAALSRYTGVDPRDWVFAAGAHGKPYVAEPTVEGLPAFNLAHATGLVVCAVAPAVEVGVDVEHPDRITDALALVEAACSPEERARLQALPAADRPAQFAALFTLKEAYLKARGLGLSVPLDGLTVTLDPPGLTTAALDHDPTEWQLDRLFLSGYQIAVALRRRGPDLAITLRQSATAAIHSG